MSRLRWFVALALCAAILAGVAAVTHLAAAQGEATPPATSAPGGEAATSAPVGEPPSLLTDANPIISVVVGVSETLYEQDPFETSRVRSSTNRVRALLYIRADGTVETKQVG